MSSLRSYCLGHPNIQIWVSDNEKAGSKNPLEHGAKWNYRKTFINAVGFGRAFLKIDIFVIVIGVMEMVACLNLSTFPLYKNKREGCNLQLFLDLILFFQIRQIWGYQSA